MITTKTEMAITRKLQIAEEKCAGLEAENQRLLQRIQWLQEERVAINDKYLPVLTNAMLALERHKESFHGLPEEQTWMMLSRHALVAFRNLQEALLTTRKSG